MARSSRSDFTLVVIGLREFERELRLADPQFPRELRVRNKTSAEIVADEMRERVPVRGGRLKGSIKAGASSRSAYVKAGTPKTVPYALPINFGWKARNIESQEFTYSAIEAKNEEVVEQYGEAIDDLMRRAFPKGVL